jgi:murein DD-endopeptidase MepM/ murein hydrolase activator NlpD
VDGFRVYQQDAAGAWPLVGIAGPMNRSLAVTGLSPGQTYYFHVGAFNANAETWSTAPGRADTIPNPAPPTSLSASNVGATSYVANWVYNGPAADGFRIYQQNDAGAWPLVGTTGQLARSFAITGLSAGRTYYFHVASVNAAAETWSTAPGRADTISGPAAPADLLASSVGPTSYVANWTYGGPAVDGFRIYQQNDVGGWPLVGTAGAAARSVAVAGLSPNRTYYFQVAAYNGAGEAWAAAPGRADTYQEGAATALSVPYPVNESWVRTKGDHPAWGDRGAAWDFAPTGVQCKDGRGNVLQLIDHAHHVLSVAAGKVVKVDTSEGNQWIAIDHGGGWLGFYLHVGDIQVSQGEMVSATTVLGFPSLLGGYGPTINTGCHLHLAFATYSTPPAVGAWSPNTASWVAFPTLAPR